MIKFTNTFFKIVKWRKYLIFLMYTVKYFTNELLLGNCGPSFTNTMPELTWHSENAQYVVADIFFFLCNQEIEITIGIFWYQLFENIIKVHDKLPSTISQSLPNSCALSLWCHPTISPSIALFSSCLQSFSASSSFPMSWVFASGGQSIGASPLASVLPMTIQG